MAKIRHNSNIKFNFEEEKWLIGILLDVWPNLLLPLITVKQNAIEYINNKLENLLNMRKKRKNKVEKKLN